MQLSINNFISFILGCSFICLSSLTFAADYKFTPRSSLTLSDYNFKQTARNGALPPSVNGGDFPEVAFEVTFKLLGIGGTFSKDGYYLDLFAQQSADEEDSFDFDALAFSETFKGDRTDTAITFGKKILKNRGSLYIGYKTGQSEADGDQGQHLTFKEKGLFIGGNYAWPIKKLGVIVFNIAFADLDGDLKEDVTNASFAPFNLDIDATSDAQGLSYGLSWSANLAKNLNYSISINAQKYTFENITDANPAAFVSDEFEEEFINTGITIFYSF